MLKKIFSPILSSFESGEGEYSYKKSHRVVLVVIGGLFLVLSMSTIATGIIFSEIGAVIPAVVFLAASVTCLVVGGLGSDRAVSKIWGSK